MYVLSSVPCRGVGLWWATAADLGQQSAEGPIGSRCEDSYLGVPQLNGSVKVAGYS